MKILIFQKWAQCSKWHKNKPKRCKKTSNKPKKVVAEDNEDKDEDEEVPVKVAKKAAVKEEAPAKKGKVYSKPSKTEVNEDELDDMLDELDDEDDED